MINCLLGFGSAILVVSLNAFERPLKCCAVAVVWPVLEVDCGQTRYAVIITMHLFRAPCRVMYVHLPRPNGSVPLLRTRDVQLLMSIKVVPPG